jgi:hypothetical protein
MIEPHPSLYVFFRERISESTFTRETTEYLVDLLVRYATPGGIPTHHEPLPLLLSHAQELPTGTLRMVAFGETGDIALARASFFPGSGPRDYLMDLGTFAYQRAIQEARILNGRAPTPFLELGDHFTIVVALLATTLK